MQRDINCSLEGVIETGTTYYFWEADLRDAF